MTAVLCVLALLLGWGLGCARCELLLCWAMRRTLKVEWHSDGTVEVSDLHKLRSGRSRSMTNALWWLWRRRYLP